MITAVTTPATAAAAMAARNWAANLRGLAASQPGFADRIQSLPASGEWVFARDGSLTLQPTPGQWLGGCSLPYRATAAMLKSLEPKGTVQCFLAPIHAAEVKAALDRLSAQQAVIVLQPDTAVIRTMLACEDFTTPIASHRLFFVTGDSWTGELRQLLAQRPGLPTPQQFIKLPTVATDVVDPLIAGASAAFTATNTERTERIRSLRDAPRQRDAVGFVAVVAGSKFELWNDAAETLAVVLNSGNAAHVRRLDCDSPLLTGPLATAEHCERADALVTADIARGDFPDVLSKDLPWVTWITRGRIPPHGAAGPHDALLVADAAWRETALKAGWPPSRVDVAGFPMMSLPASETLFDGWTILADTVPVQQPKSLADYSSHQLLWEAMDDQLRRDPFAVADIASFLHSQSRRQNVDESTLDRRLFVENLLVPGYQQSVVRALIKAGVAVRLFGRGWDQIDDFRGLSAGPIGSRQALQHVLSSSRRLIHVWPTAGTHPLFATGLPVLSRRTQALEDFVREAKSGLSVATLPVPLQPMSLERVLSVLGR